MKLLPPLATKAVAVAATAFIGYNTAVIGHAKAKEITKEENADSFIKIAEGMEYGTSYPALNGVKKRFDWWLFDENTRPFFRSIKNHVTETTKELATSLIPLGLAAGSFFLAKRSSCQARKLAANVCAGLLALGGVKMILTDVLKIGVPKEEL